MATMTVSKGNILRDGEKVGTLERKEVPTWGKPEVRWTVRDLDGKRVGGTHSTRKRALQIMERYSTPARVSEVKVMEDRYTGRRFIYAAVHWHGNTAFVSSYASEVIDGTRVWVIDYWQPCGAVMPQYSNGPGTRFTSTHILQPEQAAMVADAVTEAGLTF